MLIKKIIIDNMIKYSRYYTLGGIRFYLKDGQTYDTYGDGYEIRTLTEGKTNKIDITSTSTYRYMDCYYVLNSVDTTKKLTGSYRDRSYWLSSYASTIEITFPEPIDIETMSFNPKPRSDGGLISFNISFYDENDNLLDKRTIDNSKVLVNAITFISIDTPKKLKLDIDEEDIYTTITDNPIFVYYNDNNTPTISLTNLGSETTIPTLKHNIDDYNQFLPIVSHYAIINGNVVSNTDGNCSIAFFVNIPETSIQNQDTFYLIEGVNEASISSTQHSYGIKYTFSTKTLSLYYNDGSQHNVTGTFDLQPDITYLITMNIKNNENIEVYINDKLVINTTVDNLQTTIYNWLYGATSNATNSQLFYMSSLFQFNRLLTVDDIKNILSYYTIGYITFILNDKVYIYDEINNTFVEVDDTSPVDLNNEILKNIGNKLPLSINKDVLNTLEDYKIVSTKDILTVEGIKNNQIITTNQPITLIDAEVINSISIDGSDILIQFSEDGINYTYYKDGQFVSISNRITDGNTIEDFNNLTSEDLQNFKKDFYISVVLLNSNSRFKSITFNIKPKDYYTYTSNVDITEFYNSIKIVYKEKGEFLTVII